MQEVDHRIALFRGAGFQRPTTGAESFTSAALAPVADGTSRDSQPPGGDARRTGRVLDEVHCGGAGGVLALSIPQLCRGGTSPARVMGDRRASR